MADDPSREVAQITPQDAADAGPSDAALVARARRERAAFAPLYDRYATRLYRYARARTGSHASAQDIVSETMLAAIEGLDRFDASRGSFAGWLFAIASRRIADRHRRRVRWNRAMPRLWEPATELDDAFATVIRDDDARRIRTLLAGLPDQDRELVLLRYSAELTSTEIGEALGLSASAVRMRLTRILRRLAAEYGDRP